MPGSVIPFKQPAAQEKAFNCPNCWALAKQHWHALFTGQGGSVYGAFLVSRCENCQQIALWHNQCLIYPDNAPIPIANEDTPQDVRADYDEARTVYTRSPRSAAALLRLAVQKLMVHLGEKGEKINADIGNLVKRGLPETIQKALDIVRVVGNNAVHPGQIDLNDDPGTAAAICGLVNMIVDRMISEPKHIQEMYTKLPPSSLAAIEKRDG